MAMTVLCIRRGRRTFVSSIKALTLIFGILASVIVLLNISSALYTEITSTTIQFENTYLLRTKMCASFGQINLNYTQILWKQLVPLNSSCNLLLICHSTWVVLHICRFWNYQIEKSSSKFDYTVTQFVLSYIAACPSISMKMQHYNRIKSYFQRKG